VNVDETGELPAARGAASSASGLIASAPSLNFVYEPAVAKREQLLIPLLSKCR